LTGLVEVQTIWAFQWHANIEFTAIVGAASASWTWNIRILGLTEARIGFVTAQDRIPVVAELAGQVEEESVWTSSGMLNGTVANNVALAITIGVFDKGTVGFRGAETGVDAGGNSRQNNHDKLEF
jgi:hypothetical protein